MEETPAAKASIWMDSPERYGLVSRTLHWAMAYLLIWQLFSILIWKIFGRAEWVKTVTSFGPYHGTVGLLVIVLVAVRSGWALTNRSRRPPHEPGRLGRVALTAHLTFYLLMFVVPALALLRAYGNGKGWSPWGLPLIPKTGVMVDWVVAPARALHRPLAWLLFGLIAFHILAALYHRFVLRDRILHRMAGPLRAGHAVPQTPQSKPKEIPDVA